MQAKSVIEAHSPRPIPIIPIAEGEVDVRIALGIGAAAEDDLDVRPSHHDGHFDHEHDDFDTISIDIGEYADVDSLVERVTALVRAENILRIKGYVAIENKPMRLLLQAVGDRVRVQFDEPWGARPRRSQLVIIAEHDHINPQKIREFLA